MTEGPIRRQMIRFAIPVFLGSLFQQLYNVVDSLIIGNFGSSSMLAAVSSSGSLIFLMTGFVNGIFIGAGVVIARYFGAQDRENVHLAVHTSAAFALLAGTVLTLLGLLLSPQILRWMRTPTEVLPNSVIYFRIYFAGSLPVVIYNSVSGIFQAVGNSRHPLYYLVASSVTNVLLDLLFVAVFRWGVAGAGVATVISQTLSAVLGVTRLCRSDRDYRLELRRIRLHRRMLGEILHMGIPTGLQNSVISLANLVVQSNINSFGAMAMAGCGSYSKIEGFGFLPITSFSMALTTFIGQNLGAQRPDRAKKGARFGIFTCMALAEGIGLCIYLFAPRLIALFNDEAEVVRYGTSMARTITPFYLLLSFSHCMAAVLRGGGKSVVPMVVMLACWCLFRVTYIETILRFIPNIRCIFWAYPITWSVSSVIYLILYLRGTWLKSFARP